MYFNGKDALKTSFSYDNPFLSVDAVLFLLVDFVLDETCCSK